MNSWLERDSAMRVFSVVIALFLWFQVMTEENPIDQRTYERIPVQAENVEPGFVVLDYEPKSITVVVRGARRSLSSLSPDSIKAKVDLYKMGEGRISIPVHVSVPSGFTVAQALPSLATVAVDVMVSRPVKVKVDISGAPSEDFEALGANIEPSSVTATGPKTKVVLVDAAWGKVEVTEATADVTSGVTVLPVTSEGREVTEVSLAPQLVNVVVPIKALPPSKVVPVRAAIGGSVAAGYRVASVKVDPGTVKIRGASEAISGIASVDTQPLAIDGIQSSMTREMEIALPPGVVWASSMTVRVSVEVVEDLSSNTFENVPVAIRGVPVGLGWTLLPATVSIHVHGRREAVERIEMEHLDAFVETSGLTAGTHRLSVRIQLKRTSNASRVQFSAEPSEIDVYLREMSI